MTHSLSCSKFSFHQARLTRDFHIFHYDMQLKKQILDNGMMYIGHRVVELVGVIWNFRGSSILGCQSQTKEHQYGTTVRTLCINSTLQHQPIRHIIYGGLSWEDDPWPGDKSIAWAHQARARPFSQKTRDLTLALKPTMVTGAKIKLINLETRPKTARAAANSVLFSLLPFADLQIT